jgi:hypothetical protein
MCSSVSSTFAGCGIYIQKFSFSNAIELGTIQIASFVRMKRIFLFPGMTFQYGSTPPKGTYFASLCGE